MKELFVEELPQYHKGRLGKAEAPCFYDEKRAESLNGDANPFVEVRVGGAAVSVRYAEPVQLERVMDTAKT